MFKKLSSLLIFLFLAVVAGAQEFKGGLILGFSGSQIDGDSYSGYKKFGLLGGVYANREINDQLNWQVEVKFNGKGASEMIQNPVDTSLAANYSVSLRYIEVPILLKYNLDNKFSLQGGLCAGYLYSQSINDYYGYGLIYPNVPFNSYEISGILGFTYLLFQNAKVDFRWNYSLRPIQDFPTYIGWYFKSGMFNNVLQLSFAYQLGSL